MDLLFWIYLINAVILINHEVDSAYWQEWKLLNSNAKNGINVFLLMHIPMLFFTLLGLVLIYEHKFSGMIISLFLSSGGLFAFFFHFYHLRKGRPEFNTPISKAMIISTFVLSIFQVFLTIRQMALS
jgi:uncharacterized membrane protein